MSVPCINFTVNGVIKCEIVSGPVWLHLPQIWHADVRCLGDVSCITTVQTENPVLAKNKTK